MNAAGVIAATPEIGARGSRNTSGRITRENIGAEITRVRASRKNQPSVSATRRKIQNTDKIYPKRYSAGRSNHTKKPCVSALHPPACQLLAFTIPIFDFALFRNENFA